MREWGNGEENVKSDSAAFDRGRIRFADMFGRKMKFSPAPTPGGGGPYVGTRKEFLGGWSGRFRMGSLFYRAKM